MKNQENIREEPNDHTISTNMSIHKHMKSPVTHSPRLQKPYSTLRELTPGFFNNLSNASKWSQITSKETVEQKVPTIANDNSSSDEDFYESSPHLEDISNQKIISLHNGRLLALKPPKEGLYGEPLCQTVQVNLSPFQKRALLRNSYKKLDLSVCAAQDPKHYGPFHDLFEYGQSGPESTLLSILGDDFETDYSELKQSTTWQRFCNLILGSTSKREHCPGSQDSEDSELILKLVP